MATVRVAATGDSYRTTIKAGRHVITADEPRPVGTDAGPNPYDLLLSGLGACTSMTLFMYAKRKGWPLEGVRVELTHDRVPAEDREECEQEAGIVELIRRQIELEGPLDAGQRERLAYIAGRCPVYKSLTAGVTVVDAVV